MKKLLILFMASMMSVLVLAFDETTQYSQNPNAVYRLFSTQHPHVFLRLDTRNGKMDVVNWSPAPKLNTYSTLSSEDLLPEGEEPQPGRFTLYSALQVTCFILLDQVNGNMWQVQWTQEGKNSKIIPIPFKE